MLNNDNNEDVQKHVDLDISDTVDDDEDVMNDINLSHSQEECYDFDYWPKTRSINDLDGFTFKSKDTDYIAATEKVLKMINVKDRGFIVDGIRFTCLKSNKTNFQTVLSVDGKLVQMQFWGPGKSKKNGSTLQINKATGAQAYHVKLMFKAMKYLIDGTLDNSQY